MGYVTIAHLSDIPAEQTCLIQVGNCPILLIHTEGNVYALEGLCRHQGLSLAGGQVWKGVLDCPWHHFQYDIRTGENLYPRRVYPLDALPHLHDQVKPLRTYPVRVVDQEIQVEIEAPCEINAGCPNRLTG